MIWKLFDWARSTPKTTQVLEVTGQHRQRGESRTLISTVVTDEAREVWKATFGMDDDYFTVDDFIVKLTRALAQAVATGDTFWFRAAEDVAVIIHGPSWASLRVRVREYTL